MNFFGVHDPTAAWALLTFLALPPLLLAFYVTMRRIARRAKDARWEDARRELDGDPDGPDTARALALAHSSVPRSPGHTVRALAGRYKGIPVALVSSHNALLADGVARIVALPPGRPPVVERANPRAFPPADLARRLDKALGLLPPVPWELNPS